MANELRELQLQGDSTVYKLNDARITTTAVPTATHFLATDSSISSIAPITAANLASVLGVNMMPMQSGTIEDANSVPPGTYGMINDTTTLNIPSDCYGDSIIFCFGNNIYPYYFQILGRLDKIYVRFRVYDIWGNWIKI